VIDRSPAGGDYPPNPIDDMKDRTMTNDTEPTLEA